MWDKANRLQLHSQDFRISRKNGTEEMCRTMSEFSTSVPSIKPRTKTPKEHSLGKCQQSRKPDKQKPKKSKISK